MTDDTLQYAETIQKAMAGDAMAFRQLVVDFQDTVFGCAMAITRNSADAADVAQETFIQFHKHIKQFDTRRHPRPYLLQIAVNRAKNVLRRRQRHALVDSDVVEQAPVETHEPTPSESVLAAERHQGVRDMIAALPQTMREVCSLFYLGDCSCKEVASILAMNEGAVKVALNRARKRLLENGIGQWRPA